ncbi:S-adenosyl-l-methionine hydroxide adenosyltransferase family protein [Oscillatoria sp. HE19RPO]|uniref:SAM hydrolase/SAM-dependent halogenase family protein n=1 Tax=Oscillatoria sp. HE19RPO TaxID=2954806 RepID=UPI0020C5235A|nr:SAM-dependent chlorinase/fluorinase [Oscillatoria sp. HE19RPO]
MNKKELNKKELNKKAFVSLTSDFGAQGQGGGLMEGVIMSICPHAYVIHLTHELPPFNLIAAARTLEQVTFLPVGAHVCICDPGVWSDRKSLILETYRGDWLLGPDNGILIPAARSLGGIVKATTIESNNKYIRTKISQIFQGRDLFAPVAAYLSNGVSLDEFGPIIDVNNLVGSIYDEAVVIDNLVYATVIQISRFGSVHMNITYELWKQLELNHKDSIEIRHSHAESLCLPIGRTFSDVAEGEPIVLKDDYGRIEMAINMGSFAETFKIKIGDSVVFCI